MKTKTSLIILAVIAAIVAAVMFIAKPKANMPASQDSANAPISQNALDNQAAMPQDQTVIVEPTAPAAPANPEFPVSGVNPNE